MGHATILGLSSCGASAGRLYKGARIERWLHGSAVHLEQGGHGGYMHIAQAH